MAPRNPTADPIYDPFDNPAQLRKEMREIERPQREAYAAGIEEGRASSQPVVRTGGRGTAALAGYGVGRRQIERAIPGHPARTIAGLMVLSMAVSMFANEIKAAQKAKNPANAVSDVTLTHFQILIGGSGATLFLILMAKASDTGATFAQGLAMVAFLSTLLVSGGPMFAAINEYMKPKTGGPATEPQGRPAGATQNAPSSSDTGRRVAESAVH